MNTEQLLNSLQKLNSKIDELIVRMRTPISNKEWLGMDATLCLYQGGVCEIESLLEEKGEY